MPQRQSDGSQPQKGILFYLCIDYMRHFIAPQIQGANHEGMWRNALGHLRISGNLRGLIGQNIAGEIEIFRAVQPDALSTIGHRRMHLAGQFHIGLQRDPNAILSLSGQISGIGQPCLSLSQFFGQAPILCECFTIRVENKIPAMTIYYRHSADMCIR